LVSIFDKPSHNRTGLSRLGVSAICKTLQVGNGIERKGLALLRKTYSYTKIKLTRFIDCKDL